MKFIIRNNADVPIKYNRSTKWKIRNVCQKFQDLIYTEAFGYTECCKSDHYKALVKHKVSRHYFMVSYRSHRVIELWFNLNNSTFLSTIMGRMAFLNGHAWIPPYIIVNKS